jgi:hypothetical protein
MAYFCLSALEKGSGGRKKAAARYHVDVAVLNTIGNIASTKGSAIDARRMPKTGLIPPTGNELEWLKATVRQIILQVGIVEGGDKPARIAMRTLPKL